ncbi:hypothetical protein [Verminephrobacter eiseniae]|nr:hypothetical protein [Verminephrobacter eiseniae]
MAVLAGKKYGADGGDEYRATKGHYARMRAICGGVRLAVKAVT